MTRQDDWLLYVKDPTFFEKYHFGPLITDTEESIDLEIAFGQLAEGNELIQRIRKVQTENDFTGLYYVPREENRLDRSGYCVCAGKYAESVAKRLVEIGENDEAEIILSQTMEFISERNYQIGRRENKLPVLEATELISDDFIFWRRDFPKYIRGLEEAVLFMTKIPEVTRYILSAMVDYPVNDEAFYELWKASGSIEFCEDKTLIIVPDDMEMA